MSPTPAESGGIIAERRRGGKPAWYSCPTIPKAGGLEAATGAPQNVIAHDLDLRRCFESACSMTGEPVQYPIGISTERWRTRAEARVFRAGRSNKAVHAGDLCFQLRRTAMGRFVSCALALVLPGTSRPHYPRDGRTGTSAPPAAAPARSRAHGPFAGTAPMSGAIPTPFTSFTGPCPAMGRLRPARSAPPSRRRTRLPILFVKTH
jgi:hypothetical protein